MNSSALHAHLKAATTMSPLQYRARLQLHQARRLMVTEGAEASQAGFRVGFESPSQFNREYSFGIALVRDAAQMRRSAGVACK